MRAIYSRPLRTAGTLLCGVLLAMTALGTGCKSAKVTGEKYYGGAEIVPPELIYVADFALGAENIHDEPGLVTDRRVLPGRVRSLLSGSSDSPEARAQELVNLMARSLVADLKKEGFNATRIAPGSVWPAKGWIITGVFLDVEEGNRLRRSMIGLGQGATEIQLVVSVQDLAHGPPRPVQELATEASSGNGLGGAAKIAFSPWGAAARFVLAGQDLELNVKHTASQIAERIAKRFEQPPEQDPEALG